MPREGRGPKPILSELVPSVVSIMGTHYESLNERQKEIIEVVRAEEERFLSVVERGGTAIRELQAHGDTLAGDKAFYLWDTFGFPKEVTEDIWVRELGKKLSPKYEAEYRGAQEAQQEKARAAWKGSGGKALGELYHTLAGEMGPTPFTGYQHMAMKTRVVAIIRRGSEGAEGIREKEAGRGETVDLILEKTPFYAESGGQVTDTGFLMFSGGKAEVLEVAKPVGDMFVHTVKVVEGSMKEGMEVGAEIDAARRWSIMRHHTSTHLLHASLHRIVGTQATQAGSLVAPERFRFDFMSQKAVDAGQLKAVEELVNMKVLENLPVTVTETTQAEAKKRGVMALFGEKYGDRVRMVEVADFSKELCGGTHVPATGHIGPFLITSEGAVAAGVRRIEGVAGTAAIEAIAGQRASMERAAALLKCPVRELEERIEKTLADHRALENEFNALKTRMAQKDLDSRSSASEEIGGVKVLLIEADAPDPGVLRELADRALDSLKEGVVVIGTRGDGKCSLVARVSPATSKRVTAGELVKVAAEAVGGSGGGKPEMAQAGGKLPEKLPEALAKVREHLKAKLGA
jgi:alanyl-tRNA synthetase